MNKQENINSIFVAIKNEFEEIVKYIKQEDLDKLSLGTAGIYLNSIFEHLYSTEHLLKLGLIESAASIATSLWERSITLQYIMTNPIALSKEHSTHKAMKKTPWGIKHMVKSIINFENKNTKRDKNIEIELLYFQYTYSCAIKHGNPYTLSYLNRFEKDKNNKKSIGLRQNFSSEDIDLKYFILLLILMTSLDALIKFSEYYCIQEKMENLKKINFEFTKIIINKIKLNVPQIINGTFQEFDIDFIEHIKKLNIKYGNCT
jgi:hypothetical protein